MRILSMVLVFLVGTCSLVPRIAIAEPSDAGISINATPTPAVDAGAQPSTSAPAAPSEADFNPGSAARGAYEAATTGKWKVLSGFVLMMLVYASRRWLLGRIAWFKTALGGLAIAMALSTLWTFGSALAAGAALTFALLMHAVTTAATAAGLWQWLKKAAPKFGEVTQAKS